MSAELWKIFGCSANLGWPAECGHGNGPEFMGQPQKAPIGQPYTKMPPYILWFLKHFLHEVVHFLAVFSHFAKPIFNLVISDIYQHLS